MLERILTYIFKGIIYSIIIAVIGIAFSFLKGWHFLKGAYVFVLAGGALTMLLSIALLIGTPGIRKDFFSIDNRDNPYKGSEGIWPAITGIVMMIIGFAIEALMH